MLDRALDVVFPRKCAGCAAGPWPFCAACHATLAPLEPPWCERCGHPWPIPVATCRECPPGPLASTRAAFRYEGAAKSAIRRLKFAGWRDVAAAFGAGIAAGDVPEADVVTWVPLSRRRRADRGYDQARAIAVSLARELDLPARRLVRRSLRTEPQARRAADERREAMRGAFVAVGPTAGRRVLLVDDVLTTGATLAACADALVSSGAGEVHAVVAARSFSARSPPAGRPDIGRCQTNVPSVRRSIGGCQNSDRRRCTLPGGLPILERAHVRVCGCPRILLGSRRQPRAKRPT